ncbi:MAG: PKD domain-containing protein, partial [Fulvivirga sp.]|nr:PKD domain-containing protein [Fulvivirga sp.]
SNQQNPVHTYSDPGIYTATLTVTTNQGCESSVDQIVRVGRVPDVNFAWSSICNGDATEFMNLTEEDVNTDIVNFTWDFGDGESISGPDGGNIPAGTHGGRTFGTYNDPFHEYIAIGNYNVTLTVETSDGCTNSLTQRIFILPFNVLTPSADDAYFEDFESGTGGWVANALVEIVNNDTIPSDTSWVYGEPTWEGNTRAGSNAWWTGANGGSYFPNERSFMNGPCFDLTQLTRPMIAMDIWYETQDGFDGAVLQYSINGGITWVNVGTVSEGINWYNASGLISRPGDRPSDFNDGDRGWTGTSDGWVSARFSLEDIPEVERDFVRFRIAFATDANDPTGTDLNGFAFDNVFIGNKTRTVVIEHFTDTEIPLSNLANDTLEIIREAQITQSGVEDFITLQYHINDSGQDPFYLDNPGDASARASFYGVSQAPKSVMDGNQFNGSTFDISEEIIDKRSLLDPVFDITIDPLTSAEDVISTSLTVEANDTLNRPVFVQMVVIEDSITLDGRVYRNVVKKLMFDGQGRALDIPWTPGVAETLNTSWTIDMEIFNPDNLYLIALVQDKVTREIYGTEIIKSPVKDRGVITDLTDDLIGQVKQIEIYPNPVNGVLNFGLEGRLLEDYNWKIVDQRGLTLLEGNHNFEDRNKATRTDELANGIYYVVIGTKDKPLMYKKLAIMNRQ